jgi:hypothetical protein
MTIHIILVDGSALDGSAWKAAGTTILVTSPKKQIWKSFSKATGAQMCYMPIWTWEEISVCRSLVFGKLDGILVNDLYEKWWDPQTLY